MPILALLGSLHTLKKVVWKYEELKEEIYAAGILVSSGYDVKSYPQVWTERDCNTRTRLIPADKPEATKLLSSKLIASLNAFEKRRQLIHYFLGVWLAIKNLPLLYTTRKVNAQLFVIFYFSIFMLPIPLWVNRKQISSKNQN